MIDAWTLEGTRFRGTNPAGKAASWTWPELLQRFGNPAQLADGDGPEPTGRKGRKAWSDARKARLGAWSAATFRGNYRRADNVRDVGALVLDLDSSPDSEPPKRGEPDLDPTGLRTALAVALPGVAWAAHTTATSRPGAWRWRVVVPYSRPVTGAAHKAIVAAVRLVAVDSDAPAMIEADPGPSMDPARLWYVPARDPVAPESYHVTSSDGDPLDVDALLVSHRNGDEPDDQLAERLEADCDAMRAELWPADAPTIAPDPIGDFLDNPAPPLRWLVTRRVPNPDGSSRAAGLLPMGDASILAGAGSAGKSWALLQLALAVASGARCFDAFDVPEPGAVAMLLAESRPDATHNRIRAAVRAMELGPAALDAARANLRTYSLAGRPIAFTDRDGDDTPEYRTWLEYLADTAPPDGWRCVILDPLARLAGPGVETDQHAATRFVQQAERLADLPGSPAIVVSHHVSQDSIRNAVEDSTAIRGVGGIKDAARFALLLRALPAIELPGQPTTPELLRLVTVKANDAPATPLVHLGRDDHGALRPVSAEVVELYERAAIVRSALNARAKARRDAIVKQWKDAKRSGSDEVTAAAMLAALADAPSNDDHDQPDDDPAIRAAVEGL